jgi:hypothetical protein
MLPVNVVTWSNVWLVFFGIKFFVIVWGGRRGHFDCGIFIYLSAEKWILNAILKII